MISVVIYKRVHKHKQLPRASKVQDIQKRKNIFSYICVYANLYDSDVTTSSNTEQSRLQDCIVHGNAVGCAVGGVQYAAPWRLHGKVVLIYLMKYDSYKFTTRIR